MAGMTLDEAKTVMAKRRRFFYFDTNEHRANGTVMLDGSYTLEELEAIGTLAKDHFASHLQPDLTGDAKP